MITLTGGEKYNIKQIVILISEMYPSIQPLVEKDKIPDSDVRSLYVFGLKIFTGLYQGLTTNIIKHDPELKKMFFEFDMIYSESGVTSYNKEYIINAMKELPALQKKLISLIDDDTSARDGVLQEIMKKLNIKDPNAKKRKSSFFD